MLDVPELERRWKRYRRTKQLPQTIAISLLIVSAAAVGLFTLFPLYETTHAGPVEKAASIAAADAVTPSPERTPAAPVLPRSSHSVSVQTIIASSSASSTQPVAVHQASSRMNAASSVPLQESKTTVLTPSMGFMQDFESDVMRYYVDTPASGVQSSIESRHSVVRMSSAPVQPSSLPAIIPVTPPVSPVVSGATQRQNPAGPVVSSSDSMQQSSVRRTMLIQRENDMKDIQDVIARFKKNKNPALSLFVAKRYYNIGNYQQAYNYALITNELDSNIEDSWLIFSKSLYHLDQKEMAIKTLQTYYQDSGSVKAKIALDQMNEGELTE